jgi:hypothetical protein
MLSFLIFLVTYLPPQPQATGDYFYFEKIDNIAIIYVEGEEVYRTEQVKGNPDLELTISLENFLNEGTQEILIQLENGHSYNPNIKDKHWEIRYELYLDDQPVDYIWEYADDSRTGIVFEKKYKLSEWR